MSVPDRSKNRNATNIYDESVHLARLAGSEGKISPRDVTFGNPRLGRKDKWMRGGTVMPSADMSLAEYEAWAAQKKKEGWTDWKAEKPMSSEDLKQIKAARRKSR